MKEEIRKIITAKLIDITFRICPKGEFKSQFSLFIFNNLQKL